MRCDLRFKEWRPKTLQVSICLDIYVRCWNRSVGTRYACSGEATIIGRLSECVSPWYTTGHVGRLASYTTTICEQEYNENRSNSEIIEGNASTHCKFKYYSTALRSRRNSSISSRFSFPLFPLQHHRALHAQRQMVLLLFCLSLLL